MQMIMHDNEAINNYPFIFRQEVHAGNNDVFVFILLQQLFPFQVGGSKELRILSDEGGHGLKLRQVGLTSVVGDAYAQNKLALLRLLVMLTHGSCGTTPSNGVNVFVFILLQQWFPFQVGGSKELRILSDEGGHCLKLRQVGLTSVVGDACAQKLRHNTNNGVKRTIAWRCSSRWN